tara:strand:+ start:337 stop:477 length:141 start_codon:yes stop_codon:yes gene_type:complete
VITIGRLLLAAALIAVCALWGVEIIEFTVDSWHVLLETARVTVEEL